MNEKTWKISGWMVKPSGKTSGRRKVKRKGKGDQWWPDILVARKIGEQGLPNGEAKGEEVDQRSPESEAKGKRRPTMVGQFGGEEVR